MHIYGDNEWGYIQVSHLRISKDPPQGDCSARSILNANRIGEENNSKDNDHNAFYTCDTSKSNFEI